LFSLTLDDQEATIGTLLRLFPDGVSADHSELALVHAATSLAQGRLEEAAAQLALAESHVQSAPPARRHRLAVAIAALRLAVARHSGQFTQVVKQVHLLDASIADESNDQIAMGSELRVSR
jgi:LuxR family maltose regulon positive regulatory protein